MLQHLPQVTLSHLAQNAQQRWFSKREVVLHKDEHSASLSFLLEGRLQGLDFTSDGREVGLYFISPGDYFGEVALIDNEKQPEFVTALARSQVVTLPKDIIRPVLFGVPKIAEALCSPCWVKCLPMTGSLRWPVTMPSATAPRRPARRCGARRCRIW